MTQESGALVEITPEVREAVRRSADSGLRATPSRVETGGILTGTVQDGRLLITATEPIRCDHKYGAAYQLSPDECDNMRAAAETIRSSRTREIAGYFRSCVGDRFRVFPDDEIIVREVLPEAQFILLARPLAAGVSMARLFERDAAGSWAEAAHFELVPSVSRAVVPSGRASAEPARGGFRWLPVAGGVVVVILLLLAWYQSSVRRPAAIRNPSAFGMRISTQGDSFWLTWDRNNSAVLQASDGVLRILDGSGRRDIALDAAQVQNGSVLYRPQSGDVTFRLELHRGGAMLGAETIRALDGSKPAITADGVSTSGPGGGTAALPIPPTGTTFRQTRTPSVAIESSERQVMPATPVIAQPVEASREPAVPSKPPVTAELLVNPPGALIIDAPRPVPLRIPAARVMPPPPQAPETSQSVAKASEPNQQIAPKEQPASVKDQRSAEPVAKVVAAATPAQAPAAEPVPVQSASQPPLVRPPQPLRKVLPNLRNIAPQLLFDATSIDILVSIDAAGRVIEAHPVNTEKRVNQAVVGEAVKAAMQWTFEPATNRGKPVPASHVITFRFPRGS